jgi:HlyD family secretion protein
VRRPWFVLLLLLVLVVGLGWVASRQLAKDAELQNGELTVAAQVRSEPVSVLAPSLPTTPTVGGGSSPVVAGTLASVAVSAGTRVEAGQEIGRLDDTALRLRLEAARAAARGAHARVGIVDANLGTVADNSVTLADARRKLDDTLVKLRASRAEVAANLAQARAAVESLPPTLPPTLPPGVPDPRPLVPKLEAALAQIDAGLAKATAARAKLDSGSAKIADARSQLRNARDLTVLAADAADAGVDVARARLALTVVRAPYAGTLTWVAERGSVLFAGGPVAHIDPDGSVLLDTYLDTAEAALVAVGSSARAGTDSYPGSSYAGRVSAIRPVYEYPPTSLPTRLIHMTRAFRVTVTLDDTAAPFPPGTPADLTITARSQVR